MSVIGRLDEGVEALLINPLKKGQTPAEEKREESTLPAPASEERAAEPEHEKLETDAPLPVWLL